MNEPPSHEQERMRVLLGTLTTATEQLAETRRERDAIAETLRLSQASRQSLGDELQHRVRNMLAVIRSVLRRTLEACPSPDEFANHFEGRLDAIARYQTKGMQGQGRSVELEDIVRDELLPTGCLDTPRCAISGPTVPIEGDALEPVTLTVHELATNAFKFGALRHAGGRLDIHWSVAAGRDGATLHFRWVETGVPVIAATPQRRGFGRRYIEEALPYQLGASTVFELRPGGIACTLVLPMRHAGVSAEPTSSDGRFGAVPSPELYRKIEL